MTSLAARYEAGEWTDVWAEIRRLGPLPTSRRAEVEEVAHSTMRRARTHIDHIVDGLIRIGFEPASSDVPLIAPPPCDVFDRIGKLEDALGPIPEALKASMCEIGGVCLLGDCPPLALYYHGGPSSRVASIPPGADFPDPLCLPGVDSLELELDERLQNSAELLAEPFAFAPDELHKANISGATHDVWLPDAHADPVLVGVAGRPGITLVEYLRTSVRWGGLPGYSFASAARPKDLEQLMSHPQF